MPAAQWAVSRRASHKLRKDKRPKKINGSSKAAPLLIESVERRKWLQTGVNLVQTEKRL
ncbi:Hypothetical protein SMAX5B_008779 [Scophthalmus maximus]|uniref:Uncharacterized protein n=1 Tax=Scophthalmus maximus TaxID=52904 RepID=A0A2U9CCY9_SCOMX|nr:Hypothetical protein SMAX5B_008779 [Scophthalmus maximus]